MKQATRNFLAAVLVLLPWVTNSPAQNDGMRGQLFSFEGRVTEKEGPLAVSVGIKRKANTSVVQRVVSQNQSK